MFGGPAWLGCFLLKFFTYVNGLSIVTLVFMVYAICCEFRVPDGTSVRHHPVQYAFYILVSISDALIPTMILNSLFSPTFCHCGHTASWGSSRCCGWLGLVLHGSLGNLDICGLPGVLHSWGGAPLVYLSSLSEAGSEQTGLTCLVDGLSECRWTSLTQKTTSRLLCFRALGWDIRKGSSLG